MEKVLQMGVAHTGSNGAKARRGNLISRLGSFLLMLTLGFFITQPSSVSARTAENMVNPPAVSTTVVIDDCKEMEGKGMMNANSKGMEGMMNSKGMEGMMNSKGMEGMMNSNGM